MMKSGNREDYLIEILRLTEGEGRAKTNDLANRLGVSPASVSEMIKVLSSDGFVTYTKYRGAELTPEGLNYARQLRRKHYIMEHFLTDVLNIDSDVAHEEAHKMEHVLSDDSAIRICHIIGTPVDDDCSSCDVQCRAATGLGRINKKLSEMMQGDRGCISHLKCEDPNTTKKLISMGFVPGRDVCVVGNGSRSGPKIITVGNTTFALDSEMASFVYVEPSDK
ncbi:MAG: DtxR family transcriptional regulator [Candidatus Methanomethylophilaceae archaeon]|nr:DtxR family transcriptional regulator, Mn-dependent transcriptional regulator [Candidatus Methanomethylophilaceae archaeon]